MSRFALLFTEQEASFLTRQGISLEALLDAPTMRARADDMPCWLHTHVIPACRHADGTISSSSVLDAWRMASEDSDEVAPGFAAIHRLSDLRDLDETASTQMTTLSDQLKAASELLEVLLLRGAHRMLLKERNDAFQKIHAASHDESVQVFAVVVVAAIRHHHAHPEELPELVKTRNARRALCHGELVGHLVPGSVAGSAGPVVLPDEADREATFSVYKTNYPASFLTQSFLLVFCTGRIVTAHTQIVRTSTAGYVRFSSI